MAVYTSRATLWIAAVGLVLAAAFLYWYVKHIQVLSAAVVSQTGDQFVLELQFDVPIQYTGHYPLDHGPVLQIQVRTGWPYQYAGNVYFDASDVKTRFLGAHPLLRLAFENNVPGGPMVSMQFNRSQQFHVSPGKQPNSLRVTLISPAFAAQ
ncbi:MAG: hypothetical protein OEW08_09070 [Gammaproteobacteria bacterium]|nr:hypothetical protein [Gammaproteobacteria bacterium]